MKRAHLVLIVAAAAIVVVGSIFLVVKREKFHFQVSPWKTHSQCMAGYIGAPVSFAYDGDATRFNNCNGVAMNISKKDSGCGCGGGDDTTAEPYQWSSYDNGYTNHSSYAALGETSTDLQPFVLGAPRVHHPLNSLYTGGTPDIFHRSGQSTSEGYCSSCSG
jgi:hypothetical protein